MKTEKKYYALPPDIAAKLNIPTPQKYIKALPKAGGLSTINTQFVIDTFNDVFGPCGWSVVDRSVEYQDEKEIVRTGRLYFPAYNVYTPYQFGGAERRNNGSLADVHKGAETNLLSKLAPFTGLTADVFRGDHDTRRPANNYQKPANNKITQADRSPTGGKYKTATKEDCNAWANNGGGALYGLNGDIIQIDGETFQVPQAYIARLKALKCYDPARFPENTGGYEDNNPPMTPERWPELKDDRRLSLKGREGRWLFTRTQGEKLVACDLQQIFIQRMTNYQQNNFKGTIGPPKLPQL